MPNVSAAHIDDRLDTKPRFVNNINVYSRRRPLLPPARYTHTRTHHHTHFPPKEQALSSPNSHLNHITRAIELDSASALII